MGIGGRDNAEFSQIALYTRCPYLYGLQYVRKMQQPVTMPMVFGTAMHMALKEYGEYVVKTGQHDPEMASAFWRLVTGNPERLARPLNFEQYTRGEQTMRSLATDSNLDLSNAVEFEKRFRVDFAGVPTVGIMDRVDNLGNGMYLIVDYKSGGQFFSYDEVANNLQLTIYAAALEVLLEGELSNVRVAVYQVTTNTYMEVMKTADDLDAVKEYVRDTYRRMTVDKQLEATPGFACVQYGGCWAANICKEHECTLIDTQEGPLDLAAVESPEILRWLSALEPVQKKMREALSSRIAESGVVSYGDLKADLVPVKAKDVDSDSVDKLLSEYGRFGLVAMRFMNLDSRRFPGAIRELQQAIEQSGQADAQKDLLLKHLDDLVEKAVTEKQGKPRLRIGR